jgi:hypothetical protein
LVGEINLNLKESKTLFSKFIPKFDISNQDTKYKLNLYICSRGNCNYTSFQAEEEFIHNLKEELREQALPVPY